MTSDVDVDRDLCIGSGTCVRLAPGVFALDDEEISVVVDPHAADLSKLRLAAGALSHGSDTDRRAAERRS